MKQYWFGMQCVSRTKGSSWKNWPLTGKIFDDGEIVEAIRPAPGDPLAASEPAELKAKAIAVHVELEPMIVGQVTSTTASSAIPEIHRGGGPRLAEIMSTEVLPETVHCSAGSVSTEARGPLDPAG